MDSPGTEVTAAVRAGCVRPVRLDPTGVAGPTRGQARSKRWRRSSHGLYVPDDVELTTDQRIVEASMLVPPRCAITGWAALSWMGGRWFPGTDAAGRPLPIPIVIGTKDVARRPGIVVSGEGFSPGLVRWVDGVPITEPCYAVSYEMRYAASVEDAVIVADMACFDDLVSLEELTTLLTPKQNGWTGIPLARKAAALAEENVWSPMESRLRLVWREIRPRALLECNQPVFTTTGRHLATPDLFDPIAGVVGEYDGGGHLERSQRDVDIEREAALRALGLEIVVMTAGDRVRSGAFARRLAEAYERAAAARREPPAWTSAPPPGWIDTSSVEARRSLSADERRWLLRYRGAPLR